MSSPASPISPESLDMVEPLVRMYCGFLEEKERRGTPMPNLTRIGYLDPEDSYPNSACFREYLELCGAHAHNIIQDLREKPSIPNITLTEAGQFRFADGKVVFSNNVKDDTWSITLPVPDNAIHEYSASGGCLGPKKRIININSFVLKVNSNEIVISAKGNVTARRLLGLGTLTTIDMENLPISIIHLIPISWELLTVNELLSYLS